ncbi:hypothetical protein QQ045_010541 [Rhodiola kirilowii]
MVHCLTVADQQSENQNRIRNADVSTSAAAAATPTPHVGSKSQATAEATIVGISSGKMTIDLLLLYAANLILLSEGLLSSRFLQSGSANGNFLTKEEHWFNQTLDHFSPYDHRKFEQRYYEFLDYFRQPDGPIFLKICGESSCNGIPNDYIQVLAKKFGAAVVSLEHRYYGKSSPFKLLTTKNLQFLSSKQALFDLAAFRQYYQDSLNLKHNRLNAENPWFTFGISYSGALSAWFRLKFPHLTCGSLASSAVVEAVQNFTDFDRQVGISAGKECEVALREINELVENKFSTNETELKAMFHASQLQIAGDFMYLLADAAATAFQYGYPDALCSPIVEAKNGGHDLLDAYATYVKDFYIGTFGASVESYDQRNLKNSSNTGRSWWFQVCTEVAYFQVAPSNDSLRSSKLDARYHLDLCKNVFGEGIYPEVVATNLYYGGKNIAGSKIVFANGSQDPWQGATKQTSSPNIPSFTITCHNCGHGVDMRGCPQIPVSLGGNSQNCSSPETVNKARQNIIDRIDLWLSQCQPKGS